MHEEGLMLFLNTLHIDHEAQGLGEEGLLRHEDAPEFHPAIGERMVDWLGRAAKGAVPASTGLREGGPLKSKEGGTDPTATHAGKRLRQQKVTEVYGGEWVARHKKAFLCWLYSSGVAFNAFRNEAWEAYQQVLLEQPGSLPRTVLPGHSEIASMHAVETHRAKLAEELEEVRQPFWVIGATILSDGRKSRDGRPIVNFLATGSRGVVMYRTINREGEPDDAVHVLRRWASSSTSSGSVGLSGFGDWGGAEGRARGRACSGDAETIECTSWWSQYGAGTPELQRWALRVMHMWSCAPPTKRNWAVHEGIHTKKRNQLAFEKVVQLVEITANVRLTEYRRVGCGYVLPWQRDEGMLDCQAGIELELVRTGTRKGMAQEEIAQEVVHITCDPIGASTPPPATAVFELRACIFRPYPRDDDFDDERLPEAANDPALPIPREIDETHADAKDVETRTYTTRRGGDFDEMEMMGENEDRWGLFGEVASTGDVLDERVGGSHARSSRAEVGITTPTATRPQSSIPPPPAPSSAPPPAPSSAPPPASSPPPPPAQSSAPFGATSSFEFSANSYSMSSAMYYSVSCATSCFKSCATSSSGYCITIARFASSAARYRGGDAGVDILLASARSSAQIYGDSSVEVTITFPEGFAGGGWTPCHSEGHGGGSRSGGGGDSSANGGGGGSSSGGGGTSSGDGEEEVRVGVDVVGEEVDGVDAEERLMQQFITEEVDPVVGGFTSGVARGLGMSPPTGCAGSEMGTHFDFDLSMGAPPSCSGAASTGGAPSIDEMAGETGSRTSTERTAAESPDAARDIIEREKALLMAFNDPRAPAFARALEERRRQETGRDGRQGGLVAGAARTDITEAVAAEAVDEVVEGGPQIVVEAGVGGPQTVDEAVEAGQGRDGGGGRLTTRNS
ncbi:hypothetical protein CBR_g46239 [Chara braunii]|uniref:DUF659 domain-containing protein n=1 Tax=Chara braunii TaxID=69332 RepID=A0A388K3V2_CHABU|nr:hypothetical protein CBR_g46239 [Chara braunii]|eukprot:GBG64696.1 hypothetical protein CBR_g46239 [Chara braunii]